jgi:hypothetical protein
MFSLCRSHLHNHEFVVFINKEKLNYLIGDKDVTTKLIQLLEREEKPVLLATKLTKKPNFPDTHEAAMETSNDEVTPQPALLYPVPTQIVRRA